MFDLAAPLAIHAFLEVVKSAAWQEQPRQDPMQSSAGARALGFLSEFRRLAFVQFGLQSRPAVDTSTLLGPLGLEASRGSFGAHNLHVSNHCRSVCLARHRRCRWAKPLPQRYPLAGHGFVDEEDAQSAMEAVIICSTLRCSILDLGL